MQLRLRWTNAIALGAAVLMAVTMLGYQAYGAPRPPSLRLIGPERVVELERFEENPVPLDLGVYLAAIGAPFEIHVRRLGAGFELRQVVRGRDGKPETLRRLPGDLVAEDSDGLRRFFRVTARTLDGTEITTMQAPLCPAGYWVSRYDDSGPDVPTYPTQSGCYWRFTTQALVWGIDRGWATMAPEPWATQMDLPLGTYTVSVEVNERYRRLLDIEDAHASATVKVRIVEGQGWPEEPGEFERFRRRSGGSARRGPERSPEVQRNADGLPDLVAIQSHGISVENIEGRDALTFGATVWNAGPGPLVVEGFRRGGKTMKAYQYFYRDGEPVGRAYAGTLEFDPRDGHNHWHFVDFAGFRLLTSDGQKVVRSKKEAYCLAPTDAVDMTLPNANWNPSWTGLGTSCGGPRSIWIREVLDVGWGDTYHQWLPGQSFDITDVPNGDYSIEVLANPFGRLYERRTDNNRSIRRIELGGEPGARTVRYA